MCVKPRIVAQIVLFFPICYGVFSYIDTFPGHRSKQVMIGSDLFQISVTQGAEPSYRLLRAIPDGLESYHIKLRKLDRGTKIQRVTGFTETQVAVNADTVDSDGENLLFDSPGQAHIVVYSSDQALCDKLKAEAASFRFAPRASKSATLIMATFEWLLVSVLYLLFATAGSEK